jgi:hypothetical protein
MRQLITVYDILLRQIIMIRGGPHEHVAVTCHRYIHRLESATARLGQKLPAQAAGDDSRPYKQVSPSGKSDKATACAHLAADTNGTLSRATKQKHLSANLTAHLHNADDLLWHQGIAILYGYLSLQQASFGIFPEVTGIGLRLIVFNPEVIFFPGCSYMVLPFWHGNRHYATPPLHENLLEVEIIG